jgi:hypothetical protein
MFVLKVWCVDVWYAVCCAGCGDVCVGGLVCQCVCSMLCWLRRHLCWRLGVAVSDVLCVLYWLDRCLCWRFDVSMCDMLCVVLLRRWLCWGLDVSMWGLLCVDDCTDVCVEGLMCRCCVLWVMRRCLCRRRDVSMCDMLCVVMDASMFVLRFGVSICGCCVSLWMRRCLCRCVTCGYADVMVDSVMSSFPKLKHNSAEKWELCEKSWVMESTEASAFVKFCTPWNLLRNKVHTKTYHHELNANYRRPPRLLPVEITASHHNLLRPRSLEKNVVKKILKCRKLENTTKYWYSTWWKDVHWTGLGRLLARSLFFKTSRSSAWWSLWSHEKIAVDVFNSLATNPIYQTISRFCELVFLMAATFECVPHTDDTSTPAQGSFLHMNIRSFYVRSDGHHSTHIPTTVRTHGQSIGVRLDRAKYS